MQTIICPHCKKTIELTEALSQEYKESLVADLEATHKEDLKKQKHELEEKTEKRIRDELNLKLREKEEENEESVKKAKKLQDDVLEQMKLVRELKEKDSERELEMAKKLAENEEKIRTDAQKKAEEEQHSKLLAKDKQLQDALKEVEDMKRKLQQGSQQLQGEAFEIEFEGLLMKQYPNDKIMPVGKGIKGGDIIQEVWDANGNYTGKILWELKNTKLWSEGWVDKLKSDKRTINAEDAVIISEVIPQNIQNAGFRNGIWVTQRNFVIPLADTLRAKLIQLYHVKKAAEGKDGKAEILYNYLSGTEFKHRVEGIIDAFSGMQKEIEKEKRYFSNKWARDEKNIRQVIDNTYGMHGDLKAIIGGSLPQIKDLEMLELGDGE